MDTLINQIVNQLEIDQEHAQRAIGAILAFCRKQAGEDFDFDGFLSKLPGSVGLLQTSAPSPTDGNAVPNTSRGSSSEVFSVIGILVWFITAFGIMDVIKSLARKFLGEGAVKMLESAGDGAELASILNKLGIDQDQGAKMLAMFVDYAKLKAGPVMIDKLMESIPALQAAIRSSKKEE